MQGMRVILLELTMNKVEDVDGVHEVVLVLLYFFLPPILSPSF